MKLTSPAFNNNEIIPKQFTCDGKDLSPPLRIEDVPPSALSLVLIMEDPDTSVGTWDHWVVWNISPQVEEIEEGNEPSGVLGKSTSGDIGYVSPCPPTGTHRYIFRLFALDILLDLSKGSSKAEVEKAIEGHVIEKTELTGLYKRS